MLLSHTIIACGLWLDREINLPVTRPVVDHPWPSPPALIAATETDPSPVVYARGKNRCDPSTGSSPYLFSGCRNKTDSRRTDPGRVGRPPKLTSCQSTCAYRLNRWQDILAQTFLGKTSASRKQGQKSVQCCPGKVVPDGN